VSRRCRRWPATQIGNEPRVPGVGNELVRGSCCSRSPLGGLLPTTTLVRPSIRRFGMLPHADESTLLFLTISIDGGRFMSVNVKNEGVSSSRPLGVSWLPRRKLSEAKFTSMSNFLPICERKILNVKGSPVLSEFLRLKRHCNAFFPPRSR